MKLAGNYRIAAPREAVWRALLDPEVMQRILPGCEKLQPAGEHRYTAQVRAGVGSIRGSFSGEVSLSELDPPNAYTLRSHMKAGVGFVEGVGRLQLADAEQAGETPLPPATVIDYSGEVKVGGMLASIAGRLIEAAARKNMDEMFARLGHELAPAQLDARSGQST
jgi:carbon monoxide dehydrogenase subunit G